MTFEYKSYRTKLHKKSPFQSCHKNFPLKTPQKESSSEIVFYENVSTIVEVEL